MRCEWAQIGCCSDRSLLEQLSRAVSRAGSVNVNVYSLRSRANHAPPTPAVTDVTEYPLYLHNSYVTPRTSRLTMSDPCDIVIDSNIDSYILYVRSERKWKMETFLSVDKTKIKCITSILSFAHCSQLASPSLNRLYGVTKLLECPHQ